MYMCICMCMFVFMYVCVYVCGVLCTPWHVDYKASLFFTVFCTEISQDG